MSVPEQRFEVPPEYAEVYERAYRRAYEEGQGDALGPPAPRQRRTGGPQGAQGRRLTARPLRSTRRQQSSGGARRAPARATAAPAPARRGRRAAGRRPRSLVLPALLATLVVALLLAASFALGRSSGTVGPAATSVLPGGAWVPGSQGAVESRYSGTSLPARVLGVRTGCTARPRTNTAGAVLDYRGQNVVDGDPATTWRCDGRAVGRRLRFTLPAGTTVVQVGIVPGFARSDPATGLDDYERYNRITRVQWRFDDGTVVRQRLGHDPTDRSLRTISLPPTTTAHVTLRILAVDPGRRDVTVISRVQLRAVG